MSRASAYCNARGVFGLLSELTVAFCIIPDCLNIAVDFVASSLCAGHCTTRNITPCLLYCASHFLDLLNGQFDKTISYFLIKLLYSLLHFSRCYWFFRLMQHSVG